MQPSGGTVPFSFISPLPIITAPMAAENPVTRPIDEMPVSLSASSHSQ
jgi:hypothetical protein